MSRRLRTEAAWRARLAQAEAEHAGYKKAAAAAIEAHRQFLVRERARVDELERQLKAERAEAIRHEVRLGGFLLAQQIQTARWQERAELVCRMEEAEYRERCRLALQLRALGMQTVTTEPQGVR